jgi:hypothetical protein
MKAIIEKNDVRYLQFPLSMLPEIVFNTKQTISKIIHYGIYRYAVSVIQVKENEIENVLKQFLYYLYRKKDILPEKLLEISERYISEEKLVLDQERNGFSYQSFNPESEINNLKEIINIDFEFKQQIIEFYRIYQSALFFNFEKRIKINLILEVGEEISSQITPNELHVSENLSRLMDFHDNEKQKEDKIQLITFVALKSIFGSAGYVKTNKKHIACRMIGFLSVNDIPANLPNHLLELWEKYSHRYHMDKLLAILELNWGILIYGKGMRGFYIASKKKISLENLIYTAIKESQKKKNEELKQSKKDAEKKAFLKIEQENKLRNDDNDIF